MALVVVIAAIIVVVILILQVIVVVALVVVVVALAVVEAVVVVIVVCQNCNKIFTLTLCDWIHHTFATIATEARVLWPNTFLSLLCSVYWILY